MATKQQINALTKIAKGSSTLPILAMVQFKPGQMVTTNLETMIIIKDDAITKTGYVDAAKVKKGGIDSIMKHWDLVKSDEFDIEDYPEIKYQDAPIELNQATTQGMIDCLATVSTDDSRPILNCIELKANGTITSTDSYTLLTKNGGHDLTALIPRQMIELVKTMKLIDNWTIGNDDKQIVMQNGNVTIVQRAIEGKYPDWTKLAPATAARRITVKSALVYEALDLIDDGNIRLDQNGAVYVQSMSNDSKRSMIAIATPETDVTLNINNMHIIMPLKNNYKDQVHLNSRYVRDAVGKSEYIQIAYNGPMDPTVVHGVSR